MAEPVAHPRRAIAFILIVVFFDMAGVGLILPVLPDLIEQVGGLRLNDAAQVGGWLYALYSLALFLTAPLLGALSDRFGRRPLLLLSLAGLCIDYMICALAPSLTWLFLGRIVAGICGATQGIANAYVADFTAPEDRARAFGWLGAALGLGFVLGPALGGLLGAFGPRVPFWAAAALSAANFLWGLKALPETLPPENRRPVIWREANPFGILTVFRRHKGVLPLVAIYALYFFASAVYPAIWAFWGIAKFDWSELTIGISLAAFGVVWALFQGLLTGPVVKRLGERRAALIGLAVATLAAAGYGLVPGIIGVVVLLLFHGPEGFAQPSLTAMMSARVPETEQGALQGGLGAVTNLMMLAGTLFFAQVFGYFLSDAAPVRSPDAAYFVAAALLAVPFAMLWRRKET